MHRAEVQMDMDSQWDTSQTSESLLWISGWCDKASSELSGGKVQVTRRPTTTARGDFLLHHWWCVPCNFGGCDCHASFGANNASTDESQLDILEQQENIGRWPGWATLKWIQHSFCQLMIWKFNSTCNMSGHLTLVNLNICLVHSSSIEICIMLWMLDQHILHSSSSRTTQLDTIMDTIHMSMEKWRTDGSVRGQGVGPKRSGPPWVGAFRKSMEIL